MKNLMERAAPEMEEAPGPGEAPEMEGAPEAEDADDGVSADDSPEYQEAVALAKKKLYEEGAGEGLMEAMKSAPSVPRGLAEQTFSMMEMLDQMTEGQVPDDLVMTLAVELMGEVVEIAEAGGVQVSGRDMAQGMRMLIEKIVTALGGDMSQVGPAMDQIPADKLGAAMEQVEG